MSLNDVLKLRQFNALSVFVEGGEVFIHGELEETDKTCPACCLQILPKDEAERCGYPTGCKDAQKPHQYYEKRVRHLPFANQPTYLVFQRKDWICECGKVFLERVEFQELYSHYTVQYKEYLYELAKKQDLKRVAELEKLSWDIVEGIFLKGGGEKAESPSRKRSLLLDGVPSRRNYIQEGAF